MTYKIATGHVSYGTSPEGALSLTKRPEPRTRGFVILLASAAALGGLIFGFDIGGAGGTFVMDGFRQHFGWDDATGSQVVTDSQISFDKGMINGCFGVGAAIGAILNPAIADHFGRRLCLFASTTMFVAGATVQVISPVMSAMWVGRLIGGLGIGMLSMCVPVYIAEAAPEHTRGKLATLWQLATTIGILIASCANAGLEHVEWGWRVSFGGNIAFAVVLLASLLVLPESPRWLASRGRTDELRAVLRKLRFEDEVERELVEVTLEVEEARALGSSQWIEMFSSTNRLGYRVLLGMGLQMFQQLSGINSVMFYAPDILTTFFSKTTALYGTLALNAINFLSTFLTIYAIDRTGRVFLLLVGGATMCLTLVPLAILSAIEASEPSTPDSLGYAVVCLAAVFVVSFAYSWGPVVWVLCSEAFPLRARGKAAGLTTATNWVFTTVIGATFPIAQQTSLSGCFGFFAVLIATGTVVVYLFLPETANLTSLQIDAAFEGHEPLVCRPGYLGSAKQRGELTAVAASIARTGSRAGAAAACG